MTVKLSIVWDPELLNFTLLDLAMEYLNKGTNTIFVFSKAEEDNKINRKSAEMISEYNFECHFVKNLHTKALVGQRLMYIGSANITYSGLYKNAEAVTLERINGQKESLLQLIGETELWQVQKMK